MAMTITNLILNDKRNCNICACGVVLPHDWVVNNELSGKSMPYIIGQFTDNKNRTTFDYGKVKCVLSNPIYCACKGEKNLFKYGAKKELLFHVNAKGGRNWSFSTKILCDNPEYFDKLEEFTKKKKILLDCGVDAEYFFGDMNVITFSNSEWDKRNGPYVDVYDRDAFVKKYFTKKWFKVLHIFQIRKTPYNIFKFLDEYSGLDKYLNKVYCVNAYSEGRHISINLVVETKSGKYYRYDLKKHHSKTYDDRLLYTQFFNMCRERDIEICGYYDAIKEFI